MLALFRVIDLVDQHRRFLTLALVVIAAAALWAWGAMARREAAELAAWAERTCAAAGAEFRPAGTRRGQACGARVQALAKYERDTLSGSLKALTEAQAARDAKQSADAARAAKAAELTRAAVERMEGADAAVQDDRVGGDWLGALNGLGGLRDPAADRGASAAAGRGGSGHAPG